MYESLVMVVPVGSLRSPRPEGVLEEVEEVERMDERT
jgi:hypothetical protein